MLRVKQRLVVAVILAVVGGLVMWYSTEWADLASRTYMDRYSWTTNREKQADYADSLRLMGAVMLGVGLFRVLEPGERDGESR
ncbi:MAG TPA: hypothetical protein VNT75_14275 [Symbiobacteriaceae bacterium]|nr:hypothetical protein [Symbiobacteriaceae bacterium]